MSGGLEFRLGGGGAGRGTADMPEQTPRAPPIRACVQCRQMKMKCEGGDSPPCVRCRKAGRECMPQLPRFRADSQSSYQPVQSIRHWVPRDYHSPAGPPISIPQTPPQILQLPHSGDHFQGRPDPFQPLLRSPSVGNVYTYVPESIPTSTPARTPQDDTSSRFSPPAYEAANITSPGVQSTSSVVSISSLIRRKRKRSSLAVSNSQTPLTPGHHTYDDTQVLTKRDMRDMIQLFNERHRPFIPVLRHEEFRNTDQLIEHELPLVYCICFVTARYLHGGKEIRDAILPEINRIQREVFNVTAGSSHEDELSILKALIILYSYSDLTPASQTSESSGKVDVLYWPLKSLVEMYGLKMSLHRSAQDLKAEIRSRPGDAAGSKAFQKYTYWLYLYTMAHYCSIVSSTPPSIRIDASIRAAPGLFSEMGHNSNTAHLFGEVELSLIWEQANLRHHGLGEWWCLPDNSAPLPENTIASLLAEIDSAFDGWYSKWWSYIAANEAGSFLDYQARFARFCVTSHIIKRLMPSHNTSTTAQDRNRYTEMQKSQLVKCVACAVAVLEWPLSRGPIQRDRLRYVADSACIVISYCCLFILNALRSFRDFFDDVTIEECLENISDAAQMMVELGIDPEHKPCVQGGFILRRCQALRAAFAGDGEASRRVSKEDPLSGEKGKAKEVYAEGEEVEDQHKAVQGVAGSAGNLEGWGLLGDASTLGMDDLWDFSMMFPGIT